MVPSLEPGTVAFLAGQFADVVHDWSTPEQFAEIKRQNATEGCSGICHSHDFMDANMAMDAAFKQSFGRGCYLWDDVEQGLCTEDAMEKDVALWNAAWDQAFKGWLS